MNLRKTQIVFACLGAILGACAALYALWHERVPAAGILVCPVLVVIYPVFDFFLWDDPWLWRTVIIGNAFIYAIVARWIVGVIQRRFRSG